MDSENFKSVNSTRTKSNYVDEYISIALTLVIRLIESTNKNLDNTFSNKIYLCLHFLLDVG